MAKVPAAQARLFKNVFVCRKCGSKRKATMRKIMEGKIRCRKCFGKAFKPKRKK